MPATWLTSRDTLHNPDLRERLEGEERWEKGLVDENFLAYWLGYMGDVENPTIIQNVIEGLKDESWASSARAEFQRAGLNFDEFTDIDLSKLQADDPDKYGLLLEGLGRLKRELRILPPPNDPSDKA